MRHLRSILYALVLAPAVWVLCGVGFTQDLTGRARDAGGGPETVSAILLLVLAGAAYAILVFAPISPLGPALAGLAFLGVAVWALVAPESYAGVWPAEVTKDGFDLSRPGYALAALLAVPMLCTALSARRWTRYEAPELPLIGTLGRARGKAVAPGTPVADERTTVLPTGEPTPVVATGEPTQVVATGEPTQVVATGESTQVVATTPQPAGPAADDTPTVPVPRKDPPTEAVTHDDEPTEAVAREGEPTETIDDGPIDDGPTREVAHRTEPAEVTASPDEPTVAGAGDEDGPTEAVTVAGEHDGPTEAVAVAGEHEPTEAVTVVGEDGGPAEAVVQAEAEAAADEATAAGDGDGDGDDEERTQVIRLPVEPDQGVTQVLGTGETTQVILRREPAEPITREQVAVNRAATDQAARDRAAQERARQAFRDRAAQERARQAFEERAARAARQVGERTQRIGPLGDRTQVLPVGAGTVEPPGDHTQVLRFPTPGERTTQNGESIVEQERPDPGADPTTRLVPLQRRGDDPGEDTTADVATAPRPRSVLDQERPADEADDDTRPLPDRPQPADAADPAGRT